MRRKQQQGNSRQQILRTYIWKISIIGITPFGLKLIAGNISF